MHCAPGGKFNNQTSGVRDPAIETAEIIQLFEASYLPARRTLDKLGIPRATFYRWYGRYLCGGVEALADHRSRPDRVWNRIPAPIQAEIIDLAQRERGLRNAATITIRVLAAAISAVAAGAYAYDILVTQPSGRAIQTHEGK